MMFGSFERLVAFRYLRSRRKESSISVIALFSLAGIMLGVATLIIVMSVMNGFRAELLDKILGFNGDLTVLSGTAGGLPDFEATAMKIRRVPGVTEVLPLVEGEALVSSDRAASGAKVRGERIEDLQRQLALSRHIVAGSLTDLDDNSVMLGRPSWRSALAWMWAIPSSCRSKRHDHGDRPDGAACENLSRGSLIQGRYVRI